MHTHRRLQPAAGAGYTRCTHGHSLRFQTTPLHDVVNYIAGRLKFLLNEDERRLGEGFSILERLAENRNLLANIKEAQDMLTQVGVTKFASYQWGRWRLTRGT